MVARHGFGLYVVSEVSRDKEAEIFGDHGPLSPLVATYDVETSTVRFNDVLLKADAPEAEALRLAGAPAIPLYLYQWRFGRAGKFELPDRAALAALGEAMTANKEGDQRESEIPVGYTYLGQFIAHDLTFMSNDSSKPKDIRTPTLDLDSVYDAPVSKDPVMACPANAGPLALGCTTAGHAEDLPRASNGCPVIADLRNDDNLPLAQTQVALMKFHNAVARVVPEAQVKKTVRQHFQSVVLHDYLPRVVEEATYNDVMSHGRSIVYPNGLQSEKFRLPIEFAAAAFRFGHSMIRHNYPGWNKTGPASLENFWANTFNSAKDPITQLSDQWVNQWERLLSFEDTAWAPQQTVPPIMASAIDTHLAFWLGQIREEALPPPVTTFSHVSNNLAARTLLRGHTLRLKSAEAIISAINLELPNTSTPIPKLEYYHLLDGEPGCLKESYQRRFGWDYAIRQRTPLWYYILKEAEKLGNGGRHLGPLGSRLVMETLHAAIQFSSDSIIDDSQRVNWTPHPLLKDPASGRFTFPDLIVFTATH